MSAALNKKAEEEKTQSPGESETKKPFSLKPKLKVNSKHNGTSSRQKSKQK